MRERRQRVEHLETSGSKYAELQAVGEAMGFEAQPGLKTTFKVDGTRCSVALRLDSGSVAGSQFRAFFEGPSGTGPTLLLRAETAADLADKAQLISVEVQLGDPDFDLEVYVDSTAAEHEVRRYLSRPEARRAARWLISRGFEFLQVDADGVTGSTKHSPVDLRGELPQVFDALRTLTRAGALRGKVRKAPGGFVVGVLSIAALASALLLMVAVGAMEGMQCFSVAGLSCGFIGYDLTKPVADRLVAGHSASGGRSRLIAFLVGFITGCLGVAGVLFVLK